MAPPKYYHIVNSNLKKYGISWAQHKKSPKYMIQKDKGFRDWFFNIHKNSKNIYWYGKQLNLHDDLKDVHMKDKSFRDFKNGKMMSFL